MSKQRDSFIFYRSFYEAINDLDDKNRLMLHDAISKYSLDFTEPELNGIANTLWKLIKPQLDANNKRFLDGNKGGRPIKKTTGSKNKKTTGSEIKKPNNNVNVNVNDNVNNNKNDVLRNEISLICLEKKSYDGLKDIALKWYDYKKEIKDRYKAKSSIRGFINKLNELSGGCDKIAEKIVNQSIANGWKGLFPLKETSPNTNSNDNFKPSNIKYDNE